MERLADRPEMLDGPLDDRPALIGNLRDLRRMNRLVGGTSLSRRALDALVRGRAVPAETAISLVDVGTGAADIPAALIADARRRGRRLTVVATDSRAEVLDAAVALDPTLATIDGLTFRVSDGRSLPFDDATFDVAHASLVIHHLEPDAAVAFLAELRRVARVGVVVNDLLRSRLTWVGAILLSRAVTRNRLSRNDAPLSARRAYTEREMEGLLAAAGLEPIARFRGFARHRIAIAAKPRDRSA
ncbi:MAG TPA: methyltransferase domain-containing protein [Candidatus Limnocylindrales bacterium]|nr:methyltransferase domain-containing protein [Candidatus Limnocylindrales bacterium]